MVTRLNPYLSFRGNAREVLDFYHEVFGGEIVRSAYADLHDTAVPEEQDWIMHSQLTSPSGLTIMASDTSRRMDFTPGNTMSVSLSGEDKSELQGYWDKLSEGATITAPFETAPWGDTFGMCIDKYGTTWLVNVTAVSD